MIKILSHIIHSSTTFKEDNEVFLIIEICLPLC